LKSADEDVTLPGLVQHHVKLFEELQHGSCVLDTPAVSDFKREKLQKYWQECHRVDEEEALAVDGVVRRQAKLWERKNSEPKRIIICEATRDVREVEERDRSERHEPKPARLICSWQKLCFRFLPSIHMSLGGFLDDA
jgi:hypothetical protein